LLVGSEEVDGLERQALTVGVVKPRGVLDPQLNEPVEVEQRELACLRSRFGPPAA